MRMVFKQYGLTIITVLVCIASIATIWSILRLQYQITHPLPALEESPAKAMETYQYGGDYKMRRIEKTIETGEKVSVNDYFKVWDAKGNRGSVEVLQVLGDEREMKEEVLSIENGLSFMTFSKAGQYTLSLKVSAPNQMAQLLEVAIPVQQAAASI